MSEREGPSSGSQEVDKGEKNTRTPSQPMPTGSRSVVVIIKTYCCMYQNLGLLPNLIITLCSCNQLYNVIYILKSMPSTYKQIVGKLIHK